MGEKDTKKEEIKENVEKTKTESAKKKDIKFSLVGAIAVIILLIVIAVLVFSINKLSESTAEEIAQKYLTAINDDDDEQFEKLIVTKGYIVFQEKGENEFDEYYKDDEYIEEYLEENDYDDLSEAETSISKNFKNKYKYSITEYSFEELTDIKKSTKSDEIYIIETKIKIKSDYSNSITTKSMILYVIEVDDEYKIVGVEINSIDDE